MRGNDFYNSATNEVRAEMLRNEAKLRSGDRAGTTYHSLAGVDAALEGTGRFKSEAIITGRDPSVSYPRLPEGSPWSGSGDVALQPPLGVEIDQQEPVGTAQEIERSIEALSTPPTVASVLSDEMATLPADPALAGSLPLSSASSPDDGDRGSVAIPADSADRLQDLFSKLVVRRRRL